MEKVVPDAEQRQQVSIYTDYKDMFTSGDVDAVVVCTPVVSHKDIVLSALENNLHILCEKPMAMTSAEANEMNAAAEKTNSVASIGFAFRHIPAIQYIKTLIDDGTLGDIRHFRGYFYANRLAPKDHPIEWRHRVKQAGSGVVGDLATHVYDMFCYIARERMGDVIQVSANGDIIIPKRQNAEQKSEDVTTEETLSVWMKTANKGEISIEGSRYAPFEFGFSIAGSKGSVKYTNYRYNEIELLTYEVEGVYSQNNAQVYKATPIPQEFLQGVSDDRFVRQVQAFIADIVNGNQSEATFAHGLENQLMLDIISKSLTKGERVDI